MKPKKPGEEDIYDAGAEFRHRTAEKDEKSMVAFNDVMALLLQCDPETQARIIRTLAVFFKVSLP